MKLVITYAFVAAAMFPQTGFLCVESGGNVAVEYGLACCTSSTGESCAVANIDETDCGDCHDVMIVASSISAQRQLLDVPSSAPAAMGHTDAHGLGNGTGAAMSRASIRARTHSHHLSTTVIRR